MRKLLTIALCLVMVFCFAVPAMAAVEVDMKAGDPAVLVQSEDVSTTVKVEIFKENPVYKVTVAWDDEIMFKYNFGTWDTTNLVYTKGWDSTVGTEKNVVITNYSNAELYIKPVLTTNNRANTGVEFSFNNQDYVLENADTQNGSYVDDQTGAAQKGGFTLAVGGAPKDKTVNTFTETLTVTISTVTFS